MTTNRITKTYTLSIDVVNALEERGRVTGEKFSRLVEQGIRLMLALPAEEADEERTLGPTRSEVAALRVLKSLGPGQHLTYEIGNPAALTPGVAEKALRGLEARGECFCWGAAHELSDGSGFILGWSTMAPLDAVRRVMNGWRKGAEGAPEWAKLDLVRKLALSIDDIGAVRALVSEVTGLAHEDLAIENIRERTARLNAEYAAKYPDGPK